MAITQHTSGVLNVLALANLQMLLGNVGMRGGGVNPLRGQRVDARAINRSQYTIDPFPDGFAPAFGHSEYLTNTTSISALMGRVSALWL
jgi:anaerobic selenocysteine-containing dehydrogenase